MLDIGWQELFLIGIVALIVVGPKDLPRVLRAAARVMQKARSMSREFQSSLAELAREAELDEIKRKVENSARFDLGDELRKAADPTGKLSADFDPAEFNRQLKQSVEQGPPRGPAAAAASVGDAPLPDKPIIPETLQAVEAPSAADTPPERQDALAAANTPTATSTAGETAR